MPKRSTFHAAAALLLATLLALPCAATAAPEHAEGATSIELADVRLDGATLFKLRGATSLPAAMRAAGVEARIQALADDRSIDPATVRAEPDGEFLVIYGGKTQIMAVTPPDAQAEQLKLPLLAELVVRRIREAVVDYRAARSSERLRRGALNAVGSTLLAAATAGLLLWLIARARRRLDSIMRDRLHTVGIQSFELLHADRMRAVVLGLLGLVSMAGLAAVTLAWLIYVLEQFPVSRGFAGTLLDRIMAPLSALGLGFLDALPNLLFLAILVYAIRGALRLVHAFFVAVERGTVRLREFEPEWSIPTYKLVRLAICALGLVIAYPYIPGSDSAAFKGVSLFAGVVFSLGSSTAIANIIAGYMMTYRRAFRVGDRVKIGEITGDVTGVRLQVTHLRTMKNEEVVIPNSQIINGHVLNYSTLAKESGLLLHTTVGIGYETPWRQVEAMLLEAARRTTGLAARPEPFVLQTALGDFAINYEINVGCDDAGRMLPLYSALHRNILDVFNEYGVAIMTPAYVADPSDAKLVPKSKWYEAPATADRG